MRTLLKHFTVETLSLYVVSLITSGLIFKDGLTTLFLTGFALMLISFVVKPVINIMLLPLNLITFGLFKWVGVVITLYLVTLVVPGFKIAEFVFNGYSSFWFEIPSFELVGLLSYVAFSFLISLISSIIGWLIK